MFDCAVNKQSITKDCAKRERREHWCSVNQCQWHSILGGHIKKALQMQELVGHAIEGHRFTARRSISLQCLRIEPAMFYWSMPPSFDTKLNTVNLTCAEASQSTMFSRLFVLVHTSCMWALLICKDSCPLQVLQPVIKTCNRLYYLFSPLFHKYNIRSKLWREVLQNRLAQFFDEKLLLPYSILCLHPIQNELTCTHLVIIYLRNGSGLIR